MRFQAYMMNEGRSKLITAEDFRAMAPRYCSKAINAYSKGTIIYRGNERLRATYATIDPKGGGERSSAFADGNYYTILLDNLPSWKQYPKRSQSVVCTTSYSNAESRGYGGRAYVVLPYDNAKIAVCSDEDIWMSFPHMGASNWDNDLNELNKWLHDKGFPDSNELIRQLKRAKGSDYGHDDIADAPNYLYGKLEDWITTDLSLWDFLDGQMNPKRNLFKIVKAGDTIHSSNVEVWTDSKCLIINTQATGILNEI